MRKVWVVVLLLGCHSSDGAPEIAFAITNYDHDAPRFYVNVSVGASSVMAMVDTGSTGLRVAAAALSTGDYTLEPLQIDEHFHSGVSADGCLALAEVTIGSGSATLELPDQIPIEVVEVCTNGSDSSPGCASGINGAVAILGLGMSPSLGSALGSGSAAPAFDCGSGSADETEFVLGSPIAQMPDHPAFTVSAPSYGGSTGVLRMGSDTSPTAVDSLEPRSGPALSGVSSYDDRSIVSCVGSGSDAPVCGGTLFDTGNPDLKVELANGPAGTSWTAGVDVHVNVGSGSAQLDQYCFPAGSIDGQDAIQTDSSGSGSAAVDQINLGTMLFFRDDVYFDQAAGKIGVTPRGGSNGCGA